MDLHHAQLAADAAMERNADALLRQLIGGKSVWIADQRFFFHRRMYFPPSQLGQRHGNGGSGMQRAGRALRFQMADHFRSGQGLAQVFFKGTHPRIGLGKRLVSGQFHMQLNVEQTSGAQHMYVVHRQAMLRSRALHQRKWILVLSGTGA